MLMGEVSRTHEHLLHATVLSVHRMKHAPRALRSVRAPWNMRSMNARRPLEANDAAIDTDRKEAQVHRYYAEVERIW